MDIIDLTSSPPQPVTRPEPRTKTSRTILRPLQNVHAQTISRTDPTSSPEGIEERLYLWDDLHSDSFDSLRGTTGSKSENGPKQAPSKVSIDVDKHWAKDLWYTHNSNTGNTAACAASLSKKATATPGNTLSGEAKGGNDFFFQSDYFDNAVDHDESFGMGFGATKKRRRLTPEVGPRMGTKTQPLKSNGLAKSVLDIGHESRSNAIGTAKCIGLKTSKTSILDDNPIMFTSSPDIERVGKVRKGKEQGKEQEKLRRGYERADEDGYESYEEWEIYGRRDRRKLVTSIDSPKQFIAFDDISSDLDLRDIDAVASGISSPAISLLSRGDAKEAPQAYSTGKPAEKTAVEKVSKLREKSLIAKDKLDTKEAERERKRREKEVKVRERQKAVNLAKVNRLRTDKKISTGEMIVDLPVGLEERLAEQVGQFLAPLSVECREWHSPVPHVIKWRRKVEAVYNDEMGHWEPVPRTVKPEKHVACVMAAREFVDLTMGEEGSDLDLHVLNMKAKFDGCKIIYLVEGLVAWMRKNKNIKNRAFTEAVRSQMNHEGVETGSSRRRPKKRKAQEYVDEDMIEDALLRLQVMHGTLLHHTAVPVETAEWIVVFTQHISTIPYKHASAPPNTGFCMLPGQVATGTSVPDTFLKMLQEINRVSAPIAYSIAAEYPSAARLVTGFEAHGKDMLMDLRKSANRDGAFTDRTIGRKISRRLWAIFMGGEEGSWDV